MAIGNISIARLATSLSQLTQLIHLTIHVNFDQAEDQIPLLAEEVPQDDLPRLASVKALTLYVTTQTHHDIRSLHLPLIFPNLQVILLRHSSLRCRQCEYELGHGDLSTLVSNIVKIQGEPFIK